MFCFARVMMGTMTYVENKSRAILVWKNKSDQQRAEIYVRALAGGWCAGKKGAPVGNQNARKAVDAEPKAISVQGLSPHVVRRACALVVFATAKTLWQATLK